MSGLRKCLSLFWLAPRPAGSTSGRLQAGRCATLGIYAYCGLAGGLMFFEDELVFRPKTHSMRWHAPPVDLHLLEVNPVAENGTRIHGYFLPQKGWQPDQGALLHCHAHGCNVSDLFGFARKWQQTFGRAVLIFDYPGFGKSDGTASENGCYQAAMAAYDWLVEQQGVADIIVYGHSLGGAVAIDLATRRAPRAVLVSSTFATVPEAASSVVRILPTSWLMHNRFDSIAKIARCSTPLFFAHGTDDGRIPFEQGQRLFAASPASIKQFHAVEKGGHDLVVEPTMLDAARKFVTALR